MLIYCIPIINKFHKYFKSYIRFQKTMESKSFNSVDENKIK